MKFYSKVDMLGITYVGGDLSLLSLYSKWKNDIWINVLRDWCENDTMLQPKIHLHRSINLSSLINMETVYSLTENE